MMKLLNLTIFVLAITIGGNDRVYLYQDTDCHTLLPGGGWTTLGECHKGPIKAGWSSARVLRQRANHIETGPYGALTFYTESNCKHPDKGSKQYNISDLGCMGNFGFVANALEWSFYDPSEAERHGHGSGYHLHGEK